MWASDHSKCRYLSRLLLPGVLGGMRLRRSNARWLVRLLETALAAVAGGGVGAGAWLQVVPDGECSMPDLVDDSDSDDDGLS